MINAIVLNVSNGSAESVNNSRIKMIKLHTSGLQNTDRLVHAMYFYFSRLVLYFRELENHKPT